MRIVGIIAEYNPFHQGHAYQIKKVRELTQADFILVSMSGNFVQRGDTAIAEKRVRARAALLCGAPILHGDAFFDRLEPWIARLHRHRKRRSLCQRRRQTAS